MIVTVKNEVNEPEVRLRAPWNRGSRGALQAVQETRQKSFFLSQKFGHISTRFRQFAFRRAFLRDESPVRLLYLLLSKESLEPSGAREPYKTACG